MSMRHWTTITAYALTLGLVSAPLSVQAAHHEGGDMAAATSESAEAMPEAAEDGMTDEAAGAAEDGAAAEAAPQEASDAPAEMPEGSH